ncbi:MAG TPA: hypothetical protein DEP22_07875, partial [Porphyromonadaceae bacterium]|nr:hypothetical protein [Porphyromonadaceae bacterium]
MAQQSGMQHIIEQVREKHVPDDAVGEKCWGVIYNSVEKMHSGSSHGSETVSEVLLGMPVRLLDKKGGWRRVQAPDGYV